MSPMSASEKPTPDTIFADTALNLGTVPEQAERLTRDFFGWIRTDSLEVLIGIGLSVALYALLVLARGWARRRLARRPADGSWSWVLLKVLARTRSYFLGTLALFIFTRLLGAPHSWNALITVLFTIGAVVQGAFWARELLTSLMERRLLASGDDPSLSSAVGVVTVIINVLVWGIAAIILLDNLGVNVTALVAGLGIGGIAIGLAAQGIFADLFSALAILLDQPFRRGDSIQVGGANGVTGTVEHIGLKTTRIRALSGEIVVMSNANLLNQQIHNFAAFEERRVVLLLEVIYQTDPAVLESIPAELEKIVDSLPDCRFDRANFTTFAPSGIDFELVFFVLKPDAAAMFAERQKVAFAVNRRFRQLGIDFAFPTQVSLLAGPDGKIVPPNSDSHAIPKKKRVAAAS